MCINNLEWSVASVSLDHPSVGTCRENINTVRGGISLQLWRELHFSSSSTTFWQLINKPSSWELLEVSLNASWRHWPNSHVPYTLIVVCNLSFPRPDQSFSWPPSVIPRQIQWQDLRLGHDRFLSHSFLFSNSLMSLNTPQTNRISRSSWIRGSHSGDSQEYCLLGSEAFNSQVTESDWSVPCFYLSFQEGSGIKDYE